MSGFHDDTVCLDWSSDSMNLIIGSKDLSVRIYNNVKSKKMSLSTLSGHRDKLIGAFFDSDGKNAYTIARDGAIFTWRYEVVEFIIKDKESSKNKSLVIKSNDDDDDDVDQSDDDEDNENNDNNDNDGDENNNVEDSMIKINKKNKINKKDKIDRIKKKGIWKLLSREFLWEPHTSVTSVGFNKKTNLLVVGFDKGVFGLYEMPGCVNIHKLSVSHHSLNSACINNTGQFLCTYLGVYLATGHIYGPVYRTPRYLGIYINGYVMIHCMYKCVYVYAHCVYTCIDMCLYVCVIKSILSKKTFWTLHTC